MGYTKKRRTEGEAGPATALNDMVWPRQVILHASAARGVDAPLQVLHRAKSELLRTRVIAKPAQRSRRLLSEEEARLLEHFASRDGRASSTGRGRAGRPTTTTAPGAAPPAIPGWTKGLRPPHARKPRSWPRICARSWHGARWPTPRTSMPATEPLCCGRWACSTPRRFWIFERGPSWKPRPRTRTATTRKRRRWHRLSCMDWLAGQLEGWHEEGARHNNPRPAGVIRPGSGTDVLLRFLRQAPGRWFSIPSWSWPWAAARGRSIGRCSTWCASARWKAGSRSCRRASQCIATDREKDRQHDHDNGTPAPGGRHLRMLGGRQLGSTLKVDSFQQMKQNYHLLIFVNLSLFCI